MFSRILICLLCLCMFYSCVEHVQKKSGIQDKNISPPVLLKKVEPEYPENARSKGIAGFVELSLYVNESGIVRNIVVTKSSGAPELDEAARDYAESLKFTPAMREDKPVAIWLSWVVHYNLLYDVALFSINEYIDTIQRLTDKIGNSTSDEKENLLTDLLKEHEKYFGYMRQNPGENLNSELHPVIDESIIKQWREFIDLWPLTFIVMQDFDLRYPDSKLKSFAIDLQIKQIVEDLDRISKTPGKEKEKFYDSIYRYLKKNYPKSLENSRKEDLQLYLDY